MSNYNNLKSSINNNIYENQTQQITGTVLNAILNEMTNALGAGYQFAGVATVGMTPSEPDARIFYLAGEGIYTSFDGIQVPAGKLGILKWDNRWHLETIDGLGSGGANLTGYVSLASTDDLPDEGVATLGYLCGTNLYLYVGTGGDTKEGKYQNCGSFRGPQGLQGDTGISIQSVVQTTTSTEDEGINVITCTLENGTQSTFQIKNGSKGSQGIQGPQGVQGEPGRMQARYKQVASLPTASADTMDFIYLVESDTPDEYDMYYTEENQGAYSWQPLGTTAIQLSDYATKAELSQLDLKVNNLAMTRYYGFFPSSEDLPDDANELGYAYVGASAPFAIYEFDGDEWTDTEVTVNSIQGEDGVGFDSINTPTTPDGTAIISLTDGDTITLDLNHNHPNYPKFRLCQDRAEYNSIQTKDAQTLYLIPGEAIFFGDVLIVTGGIPPYYVPVDYIETDGTAYIDTGIIGNNDRSSEIVFIPKVPSVDYAVLGCTKDTGNTKFVLVGVHTSSKVYYAYWGSVASGIDISASISNETPVKVLTRFKNGGQGIYKKEEGESVYTDVIGSSAYNVQTERNIYLFCQNNQGSPSTIVPGLKIKYVKIFNDYGWTNLVFDGVPCYYQGEYGLWDRVTNSFFGNAAGSGAFTGPSIH